jgi:hypothetical protein
MATSKNDAEKAAKGPKALTLLKSNQSVKERADRFFVSIKRTLQRDMIDALIVKKEKLENDIFELSNFSLSTNLNQNVRQMTQEECEQRFKSIIEKEYELVLLTIEIEEKTAIFDKLFS